MKELPREELVEKALKVVSDAFVGTARGIRTPAKWDIRVTTERVKGKQRMVVTLWPKNGIMEGVGIRPSRCSGIRLDWVRSFVEVRTRGSLIVRIKTKR